MTFLSLSFLVSALQAQQVVQLSPITVVAPNRVLSLDVVPAQTIREAKPIDLADILASEMPDISAARRGPIAGDINLRGLSRDNIDITVDDTRTYCACPNRMDPPVFHVSSQQVEAISVRRGPFSVDKSSTPGGAILVSTRAASQQNNWAANAFGGSYGTIGLGLRGGGNFGLDNLATQAGIFYQQGDVYKDGTGKPITEIPTGVAAYQAPHKSGQAFRMVTAEAKTQYAVNDASTLSLSYGYQDTWDVLYPGLRMDARTDTMHRLTLGWSKSVDLPIADNLSATLAVSSVNHDMDDAFRNSATSSNPMLASNPLLLAQVQQRGYFMATKSKTRFIGANLNAEANRTHAHWRYGINAYQRKWDADNTIATIHNSMLPDVDVNLAGIWGVYETTRNQTRLEAGLRMDIAQSEAGDDISFLQTARSVNLNKRQDILPAAYALLGFQLAEKLSLYGGLGHGARLPDPQERYITLNRPGSSAEWLGNPALDPVRSTELQAGFQWEKAALSISGSAFHAWLKDYIYLEPLTGLPSPHTSGIATSYTNIDARLYGAEFALAYQLTNHWSLRTAIAWQEGQKANTTPTQPTDILGEVPPLKFQASLAWDTARWHAQIETLMQDELNRIDPALKEIPIGAWATLNLKGGYQLSERVTINGGIDNLLDTHYAVANAYVRDPFSSGVVITEPGRFAFAQLTVTY